jgi:hypothetical protein
VRFDDPTGAGLDETSITDSETEFVLSGDGADTATMNGNGQKV